MFGVDKVSLEEREEVYERTNAVDVYNDPLTNKWWQDADKPWQALAWCYEWRYTTILRSLVSHSILTYLVLVTAL